MGTSINITNHIKKWINDKGDEVTGPGEPKQILVRNVPEGLEEEHGILGETQVGEGDAVETVETE